MFAVRYDILPPTMMPWVDTSACERAEWWDLAIPASFHVQTPQEIAEGRILVPMGGTLSEGNVATTVRELSRVAPSRVYGEGCLYILLRQIHHREEKQIGALILSGPGTAEMGHPPQSWLRCLLEGEETGRATAYDLIG